MRVCVGKKPNRQCVCRVCRLWCRCYDTRRYQFVSVCEHPYRGATPHTYPGYGISLFFHNVLWLAAPPSNTVVSRMKGEIAPKRKPAA